MLYLFFVWCLLALVTLSLAGYRKVVASREDDLVHLGDTDSGLIAAQRNTEERLAMIDKWGKILTVITLVLGLVIGVFYLYQGWLESAQKVHV